MNVGIKIEHAVKKYGNFTAIPDLSLDIRSGEFFTLLGPSGCGKTTLLRMIAGFNSIEGGDFYFGDRRINDLDPAKRNIGMVFQNYAIFPHLTVRKNVEFGLKNRKLPKDEIHSKADKFMELMKISEYADRLPEKLSGGQQQRVALARALAIEPDVLLMDEPLSNLDAKLRVEMRTVIKDIQNRLGITTVYVTHDQEEAMAVSDRIAVMSEGVIQQIGTPKALYQRPVNRFVATFIGRSNVMPAKIYVDGNDISGLSTAVLKDRRILADNGLVAVIIAIDSKINKILMRPVIVSRGFVFIKDSQGLIKEAEFIVNASLQERMKEKTTFSELKNCVRSTLEPFLYRKTHRNPIVIPVIINSKATMEELQNARKTARKPRKVNTSHE